MATKRVIAYYMHKDEEAFASERLDNSERTESYVLGDAEEVEIENLRARGLLVQEIPSPAAAETPGRSFSVAAGVRRRGAASRGVTFGDPSSLDELPLNRPSYYLIHLTGPLLERYRSELDHLGVKLLEHVPPNSYKALLTLGQTQQVRSLPFVGRVQHYSREDTGVLIQPEAAAASPGSRDLRQFDVRLQPGADAGETLAWIDARRLSVAGAKGRKIRVVAEVDSPLLDELAALADVERVEEYVAPRLHNDLARERLGADSLADTAGTGLGLTGKGQVVAVADTGLDDHHPDFQGRIVGLVALGRPGDSSDPHGHGTHVAGSVLGDGTASGGLLRGAAPAAELFFQSLLDASGGLGGLPFDLVDLFEEAYQAGARIHNNSWGAATGSMYTVNSSEVDEFVSRRRDMLVVISAGNEGTANNRRNSQLGFVDWLSIGSPASAKNALVVGASRSRRSAVGEGFTQLTYGGAWPSDFPDAPISGEMVSGDEEALAAFSSRGPCDDRRIKPDLVAPGTDIASAKSSRAPLRNFWGPYPGNARYAFMGGTSMAAPLVAGCAALVREYFVARRGHEPSAALLKATLICATRQLTAADSVADHPKLPNFHQGFGMLHLPLVIPGRQNPSLRLEFLDPWRTPAEQFVRTGQRFRHQVTVAGGADLRIVLAWTDLPDRGLQNSLLLQVQHLSSNQRWQGNADVPLAISSPDPDNNVQMVRIESPPPGEYLIQVSARNLLKPSQDYALVLAGELSSTLAPV